jgi:hypothetical protein
LSERVEITVKRLSRSSVSAAITRVLDSGRERVIFGGVAHDAYRRPLR